MIHTFQPVRMLAVAGAAAALACAAAVAELPPNTRHETNRAAVAAAHLENVAKFGSNPDMLVLPGVVADRRERTVRVQAEATGLRSGEIAEFLLIGEGSGHGYESLAVAFAKPSAVHRALEFIGMAPGRPVNPQRMAYWPKGERVSIVLRAADGASNAVPRRAEDLVIDRRTDRPFATEGFVFVGSTNVAAEPPLPAGYAADVREPNSIISHYNEPETVLDVPRRAAQGDVYGSTVVNPALLFAPGAPLEFVLRPEYETSRQRVLSLSLHVETRPATNAAGPGALAFALAAANAEPLVRGGSASQTVETLARLVHEGRDPFVSIAFRDAVPLGTCRDACRLLATIETENGIRVEPPADGQLYYKSFLPNEDFRRRETRIAQPWELRLTPTNGQLRCVLTQIEEQWREDQMQPVLKPREFPVPAPADLPRLLQEHGPGLFVILVYAAPSVTYGDLMSFLRPVLAQYPTVYVFLD